MSDILIDKTVEYISKSKGFYESHKRQIPTSELAMVKYGDSRYNAKEAHKEALKRDDITPNHIAHIIKNADFETAQEALEHPKAPTESIHDALNTHEKKAEEGRTYPASFPHIKKLLGHQNAPKTKYPHISAAIKNFDEKSWKPGKPSEINLGTGKIETSRFD